MGTQKVLPEWQLPRLTKRRRKGESSQSFRARRREGRMDYRDLLRVELKRRKTLSPHYSQADFAKDLGLTPAHLCYVLKGERGLSKFAAQRVGLRIGLTGYGALRVSWLAAAENGRSVRVRQSAKMALQKKMIQEAALELKKFCASDLKWIDQAATAFGRRSLREYEQLMRRLTACGLSK